MYTVTVKIEGMDRRRRNTGLVHAILGFFLLIKSFDLYHYLESRSLVPTLPFLLVGAMSLYYAFFRSRFDPSAKHNAALRLLQSITFFSFGFLMLRIGKSIDYISLFIWAFLTLLLFFSEKRIFKDTIITLAENGVRIPGSYRDHLVPWPALESVVVRHDFITLFHKGKKYLQYQVLQDLSELELVKMNAFCKEQIERQPSLADKEGATESEANR
ncbi:hypothetical protein [Flavisolibacter nicotianae]|uniref:hypothetical protein n=1 Tax=Flavisolibacter nicotianae TaxID=2364882 RepID=UPI000EAFD6E4|nr:hypothetical protein [Flavisolibacter nicotianae]